MESTSHIEALFKLAVQRDPIHQQLFEQIFNEEDSLLNAKFLGKSERLST